MVPNGNGAGYMHLVFLWLAGADLAIERVEPRRRLCIFRPPPDAAHDPARHRDRPAISGE